MYKLHKALYGLKVYNYRYLQEVEGVYISQIKYAIEILERFDMSNNNE